MSNNKQSSVEWLKDQLEHFGNKHELQVSWATVDELAEQAKAMHKEELEFAFKGGMSLVEGHLWKPIDKFEEFYNETFEGNK